MPWGLCTSLENSWGQKYWLFHWIWHKDVHILFLIHCSLLLYTFPLFSPFLKDELWRTQEKLEHCFGPLAGSSVYLTPQGLRACCTLWWRRGKRRKPLSSGKQELLGAQNGPGSQVSSGLGPRPSTLAAPSPETLTSQRRWAKVNPPKLASFSSSKGRDCFQPYVEPHIPLKQVFMELIYRKMWWVFL